MVRRAEVKADDVKDETLKAADIGTGAVDTSELASQAVTTSKIGSALVQGGSVPVTSGYFTYPVSYSTVKSAVATSRDNSYPAQIDSITTGSAAVSGGTPGGAANQVMVVGDV